MDAPVAGLKLTEARGILWMWSIWGFMLGTLKEICTDWTHLSATHGRSEPRTGRYGVYFDLTGPEIEFWVEEFGKPDFLLYIKHQDAGAVLDYVRKRCEQLKLT